MIMEQTGTLKTPSHKNHSRDSVCPHEAQQRRERLAEKKRRMKIMRRVRLVKLALLCAAGLMLVRFGRDLAEDLRGANPENINTQASGLTPGKTMLDKETEEKLFALTQGRPDIAELYLERDAYPPEMLKALTLNQEMLGFVKGWPDSDGSVTGGFTDAELSAAHPLFIQWDERWGYYPYGDSNLGLAGCGPVCLSMVIFSLTGNESATPDKLADYSMKNRHYVSGAGTAWSLMTAAPAAYGVSAKQMELNESVMKRCLDQGGMIICAMRPGDFTTTGHFIVIHGYDEDGFLVNDPNSRERSGKTWSFSKLKSQIKNLWSFSSAA